MLAWNSRLTVIYFLVVSLSVISIVWGYSNAYILNIFIVPVLIFGLIGKFKKSFHPLIPLMLIATLFAFLGDILFSIPVEKSLFNTIGICTFIAAQSCYGLLFYYSATIKKHTSQPPLSRRWPEVLAFFLVLISSITVLPLTGEFIIASLIYAMIGSVTLILAMNRRFFVPKASHIRVMIGVSCFYISDIITGFDMYGENKFLIALITLLYSLGHFMIIKGILIQVDEIPAEKEFEKYYSSLTNK
ncbi:lysoplasmalogenase family protein [Aquiflexum lacus]|uniref:lysoplasmalogenase family protein n=1 Tax=Aquiflexum lacus TaxID=2483805 RepID=UPI0018952D1B|nr:lysoplasmalogenase family protein [Aquiflexum lacus]